MPPSRNPMGRPLLERCKRGHDMSVFRRRRRSGDPYCSACKVARNRHCYRLPSHVLEMRRLLRDGLLIEAGDAATVAWQRRVFAFFEQVERRPAASVCAGTRKAS